MQLKIDEIAERILTLGDTPEHTFSSYLKHSEIKEAKNTSNGENSVKAILSSFETLIIKQRKILKLSEEANDEGTGALMSDYIREQEKLVWMYNAFSG